VRELVFEISLKTKEKSSSCPLALLPMRLLEHSQVLDVLQFDTSGFMILCQLPANEWSNYRKSLDESEKVMVTALGEQKAGYQFLQVRGKWLAEGQQKTLSQNRFKFFQITEKLPVYQLRKPQIAGDAIRFAVTADEKVIKTLIGGLKEHDLPYSVNKLGPLTSLNESLLTGLTSQQSRILRLAYLMGYYDIPRKVSTLELARILRLDKGTVGEHLRRAEKHIFDNLLQG
jgi:hypothetical protein